MLSTNRALQLFAYGQLVPKGYNQLSGLSGAKQIAQGLTDNVPPAGALFALVQAEAKSVRWRDDNTVPTASIGMLLADGDSAWFSVDDLTHVKVIEIEASAKVNVSFYGFPD